MTETEKRDWAKAKGGGLDSPTALTDYGDRVGK
jgi:hypothetical protein